MSMLFMFAAIHPGYRHNVGDVFGVSVFTGNGTTTTMTDGIDRTYGAMDVFKMNGVMDWAVYDTARGVQKDLAFNTTGAETTQSTGVTEVSSTGITIGSLNKVNQNGANFLKYTFRNCQRFFKVATVTKTAGSNATVSLSELGTVGMVRVKRTDAAGSWYVWHRSLSVGTLMIGETTAAAATLGHITVSGTTLTLVNGVIADGTYHVEAYAHDTASDGLIQCGSFTTDGAGAASVNLGFEPQFLMVKKSSGTNGWYMIDTTRGFTTDSGYKYSLSNTNGADVDSVSNISRTSTGFNISGFSLNATFIYKAIRKIT